MKKIKLLFIPLIFIFLTSLYSCEDLFEALDDDDDDDIELTNCGSYNGPSNIDNQYDYQCQAAYAYYCNNETSALAQQCAYYKSLQQELGLPNCSYCN